jgi:hypothetical protein
MSNCSSFNKPSVLKPPVVLMPILYEKALKLVKRVRITGKWRLKDIPYENNWL